MFSVEKFQSLPGSSASEQLLFSLSQGLFAISGSPVFPQLQQSCQAAALVTHRINSCLAGYSPNLWEFEGDLGHFLLCFLQLCEEWKTCLGVGGEELEFCDRPGE